MGQRIIHSDISRDINVLGNVDHDAVGACQVQITCHGYRSVTVNHIPFWRLSRKRSVDRKICSAFDIYGIVVILIVLFVHRYRQSAFDIQHQIDAVRPDCRFVANTVECRIAERYGHGIGRLIIGGGSCRILAVAENVFHVGGRNLRPADPYTVFDQFLEICRDHDILVTHYKFRMGFRDIVDIRIAAVHGPAVKEPTLRRFIGLQIDRTSAFRHVRLIRIHIGIRMSVVHGYGMPFSAFLSGYET